MGELSKLVIRAYSNNKFTSQAGEFAVPINPEQYTQNYEVKLETTTAGGSQGTDPRYEYSVPPELKLDFVLDGTGAIAGYGQQDKDVPAQVTALMEVVYQMHGEIHQPKFLKVQWGNRPIFDCVLKNIQINYTLFKPDGTPLRAKVSTTFTSYVEPERRVRTEDKRSPDLTKVRKVKEGDRLDYLVYDMYKDPSLYLEIARANNLVNFRKLQTNKDLIFPPIKKI